jgi:microcin C transport system substrate-binding protein
LTARPTLRALTFGAIAIGAVFIAGACHAEAKHGLSSFGDLAYPADFQHFAYANPDAPKGGTFSLVGWGGVTTFDSLNNYILKGDAAQGLELLFDSLMVRAADEPDAVYGLVAKSAEVAPDGLSVTFTLRSEAKFNDGSPLTADDVVFSFETLKTKGHPLFAQTLADVVKAEALDPNTVRYSFKRTLTRDLPLTVAELPIFSKAYYASHDFAQTTLDPPLGSGPYVVGDLKQGHTISYKRNPNYWAKDLPVNRGRWNFDEIRFEYFRDRTAGMEAFKAGTYDFREEFTSKVWATEYDFPAIRAGKVKKEVLPDETPSGTQGYFLNTRREQLKDPLVRKAAEKSLLEGLGAPVSPEALGPAYLPPKTDGTGNIRNQLEEAGKLLDQAGWTMKDGKRVNAKGEQMKLEILNFEPAFERVTAPFIKNLQLLGIDASMRMVDPAQYQRRLKTFDFDITTERYTMRNTPGVELRSYFGSDAAKMDGSLNLAGISDPAVDALVERVIAAKSRDELETAARALDRVLRAGHYWVPHWYKASNNIAYWDKFSRPETKARFDRGILDTWWYHTAKAAKLTPVAAKTPDTEGGSEPGHSSPVGLIFGILLALGLAGYALIKFLRRKR